MKHGNVFGRTSKTYQASIVPVFMEVKERKLGGGTVAIENLADGTLIPAGAPVRLAKMGGTAIILDAFKVLANVSSAATAVKLADGICGTKPAKGMILGKLSGDTAAKAAALGDYTEGSGFAITANSLGELSEGDYLYICVEAGSSKKAVLPDGLSWRDILKGEGDTVASVAVVTKGQVLGDRIPTMPDAYKNALVGITFEYEL